MKSYNLSILADMNKTDQIAYFEGLLEKHGGNYLALDWNSPESQKLRFQVLKEIFVYGKKAYDLSILDVGCGFGDLYGFFKAEGMIKRNKIHYTGVDVSGKILEVAKKKYPEAKFELKDILEERHLLSFDYIFCSGVCNIRTADVASHMEFVRNMLLRMFDLVKCGVAVNFLSAGMTRPSGLEELNNSRYFYFDPQEMLNFCRFITNRYILRHDYHPGDFTIYLFK